MASNTPSGATERTETPTPRKYQPYFIDRATLPLCRAEAMTQIVEDFIEGLADSYEDCCRGDALIHTVQLKLAEVRQVLEGAIDAELPKQAHIRLADACTRLGVSPESMLAAVVEILNAAATRQDCAWETETAGRLVTVAKSLEGQS